MLEQICAHIHNYFVHQIYADTYTIKDGSIELPFLIPGQYFRIFGSRVNDGVYQYPVQDLTDETFDGVIWEMRPPKSFLALVEEISDWMDKYGEVMRNPYQSEDVIGVFRYTKMTSGKVTGDYIATWQNAYKDQLNEWRMLS